MSKTIHAQSFQQHLLRGRLGDKLLTIEGKFVVDELALPLKSQNGWFGKTFNYQYDILTYSDIGAPTWNRDLPRHRDKQSLKL